MKIITIVFCLCILFFGFLAVKNTHNADCATNHLLAVIESHCTTDDKYLAELTPADTAALRYLERKGLVEYLGVGKWRVKE